MSAYALVVALGALVPVAFAVGTSVALGALPEAAADGWDSGAGRELVRGLALGGAAFVVLQMLAPVQAALIELVSRRVDGALRDRLAAAAVGGTSIAPIEDEELRGHLSEAAGQLEYNPHSPGRAVAGLVVLAGMYVQVVAAALVVGVVLSPWAVGALVAAALLLRQTHGGTLVKLERVMASSEPQQRASQYLRRVGVAAAAAKENRLFALGGFVRERFRAASFAAIEQQRPLRKWLYGPRLLSFAGLALLGLAPVAVWVARRSAEGALSLFELVLVLQAAGLVVHGARGVPEADLPMQWGMYLYRSLVAFERGVAERHATTPSGTRDAAGLPREAIRFEGVSFAYPGSECLVLDGLDLTIPAGRSLAIVGLNGTGKTTLVKLLARLYEPTAGRIAVDGTDLRELRPAAWQRRLAAIFQDFVQYELSLADNIRFGAIERADDVAALRRAMARAGALELAEQLPRGWDTPLSRRYEGGSDLSGGQWQRVALARALFAIEGGALLLVLDEPTAALDARAEVAFFERFIELTAGLTTIVVSHRFSTVRRADRIVVLDGGRVAEQGSHEELVASGGRYARLFALQASRFALDDSSDGEALTR